MGKSGIRVKIQVTIAYLVSLSVISFVAGVLVAILVMGTGR